MNCVIALFTSLLKGIQLEHVWERMAEPWQVRHVQIFLYWRNNKYKDLISLK